MNIDSNGNLHFEDRPIAQAGVYQYMGHNIGAPDPERVYNVYIPEALLADPQTIEGFKGQPIFVDHKVHIDGQEQEIDGAIGDSVYFKNGSLIANMRLYSAKAKQAFNCGIKELSTFYKATFKPQSGTFKGKNYDYIQTSLFGANHVALVKHGRMGAECAIANSKDTPLLTNYLIFNADDIMNDETEDQTPEPAAETEGDAPPMVEQPAEELQQHEAEDTVTLISLNQRLGGIEDIVKAILLKMTDSVIDEIGEPEAEPSPIANVDDITAKVEAKLKAKMEAQKMCEKAAGVGAWQDSKTINDNALNACKMAGFYVANSSDALTALAYGLSYKDKAKPAAAPQPKAIANSKQPAKPTNHIWK